MAARTRKVSSKIDGEIIIEPENEMQTLHTVLKVIGDQFTTKDIKVLRFLYGSVLKPDLLVKITDGYSFLLAMERIGHIDESNFKQLRHLLKVVGRHDLLQFLRLRKRKSVQPDIFDEYLENSMHSVTYCPSRKRRLLDKATTVNSSNSHEDVVDILLPANNSTPERVTVPSRPTSHTQSTGSGTCGIAESSDSLDGKSSIESGIRKKQTCDIRLRVRAEYCSHDAALSGNVQSNKPELIERQFEKFTQANTILRTRDLGAIICDIKFSELTYLDAFWRDYVNGSLQEALKSVFITESLKQAVGEEAIKLLVNVDEDDYDAGRIILLQNLQD